MTHKKLSNKLSRILRKYFGFSFVESHQIAKAIISSFCNPESYLTADEEKLMRVLNQLTTIDYEKSYVLTINSTIDFKLINSTYNEWYDEYVYEYQLTNRLTGTTTTAISVW